MGSLPNKSASLTALCQRLLLARIFYVLLLALKLNLICQLVQRLLLARIVLFSCLYEIVSNFSIGSND